MIERIRACTIFEHYIADILGQLDAVLTIFCMENEIQRLRKMEPFPIPVLTPHTHTLENNIQLEAYCQAVDNEV